MSKKPQAEGGGSFFEDIFGYASLLTVFFIVKYFYDKGSSNIIIVGLYWIGVILFVLIIINFLSYFYTKVKPLFTSSSNTKKSELKNVDIDKSEILSMSNEDLIFFTDKGTLRLNNIYRGILIIGSNGSGKTESLGNPILKQLIDHNFCGIIYDYKYPQLTKVAHQYIDDTKYFRFKIIDPYRPNQSDKCNPIAPRYIHSTSFAREYAQSIIGNLLKESNTKTDFWTRSATDLLTAVIWYLKEEQPEICNLPHAMALITSRQEKLLKLLEGNMICKQMVISLIDAYENKATSQITGVISTLQSAISQINTPEICYVLSADNTNLIVNDNEDYNTICLANSPTLSSTFASIFSLITTVSMKMMNVPNRHKSYIFLDEAPTLFIPKFDEIPNTARSNKIATIFMAQDYNQMVDMYGDVKANVLFGALNNHFYGRIANSKTAELLSKQFGKYDKTFETESRSHNKSTSSGGLLSSGESRDTDGRSHNINQTIQQRDNIEASEFLNFSVGEFVGTFVDSNHQWIDKTKFKYYPEFSEIEFNPSEVFEKDDTDIMEYYKQVRLTIDEIIN